MHIKHQIKKIYKKIFFIIEDNNNIYEEYLKKTEKINYTDLCLYIDEFKFNFKKVEDFKKNLRELLNYHSEIYEYELITDILSKFESVPVVAQTKKRNKTEVLYIIDMYNIEIVKQLKILKRNTSLKPLIQKQKIMVNLKERKKIIFLIMVNLK